MITTRAVCLWMGLLCLAAGLASADDTTQTPQIRDYLALRQTLKPVPFTPQVAQAAQSSWRGRTFEIVGRIIGRTNACVATRNKPLTFMLHVPGVSEMLLVDTTKDDPAIAVDQVVHVLALFPEAASPVEHFQLKALVLESDLPSDQHTYQQAMAEARITAPASVSAADVGAVATSHDLNRKPELPSAPATGAAASSPAPPAPPRPGTEMPRELASNVPDQKIATWKSWVAGINPRLTDAELEIIVRSVLYYSAYFGLDHRLSFAMIKCESGFNPRCVSHAGAMGLTQLMPGTAKAVGCGDPWDLEKNIRGGLKYLSDQLRAFSGRSNYEQCALGLAAYNAGPNAVKRAGGVPNIPETVRHVKKVTDLFYQLWKSGMP